MEQIKPTITIVVHRKTGKLIPFDRGTNGEIIIMSTGIYNDIDEFEVREVPSWSIDWDSGYYMEIQERRFNGKSRKEN